VKHNVTKVHKTNSCNFAFLWLCSAWAVRDTTVQSYEWNQVLFHMQILLTWPLVWDDLKRQLSHVLLLHIVIIHMREIMSYSSEIAGPNKYRTIFLPCLSVFFYPACMLVINIPLRIFVAVFWPTHNHNLLLVHFEHMKLRTVRLIMHTTVVSSSAIFVINRINFTLCTADVTSAIEVQRNKYNFNEWAAKFYASSHSLG